jgi:hypothetical protein
VTERFLDVLGAARLDGALEAAAEGRPLILRARRADTAQRLLERAIYGRTSLETVTVDIDVATPQAALIEAGARCVPGIANLVECSTSPRLDYKLFVVDLGGREVGPWLTLAGTFARMRADVVEGPALVLIGNATTAPAGCEFLDDGGFVGPAEALMLVGEKRKGSGLLTECADAAAIEVSRGDLVQLGALLDLNDRERFDPTDWLGSQAVSEMKLIWRARDEVCATWLARHAPTRLRNRIWRGHVSVMFPWIANALADFLEVHGRRLPASLPDRHTGAPIPRADFEWGELVFCLNQRAPALGDKAHNIRMVRNALAHRRPLNWTMASQLEADVAALMRWS